VGFGTIVLPVAQMFENAELRAGENRRFRSSTILRNSKCVNYSEPVLSETEG
jgi:hypothetical protein